jgi:hypothetical protein
MSDLDTRELLILCETILEDGELTYDELYKLAEWLNNHPEACFEWPGDLLVAPLQKAWSDGKITKTEARQVARVIRDIRKEAAKRQREKALAQAAQLASEVARMVDLTRPNLPTIPFSTRVKSHSRRGEFYEVNLNGPTCTCPDFRSFRYGLSAGHLTRCCKHVFDAYTQLEPRDGWPGWLGAFLDFRWPPDPRQEWSVLPIRQGWLTFQRPHLVLICSAPNRWANIFAPDSGRYDRYGYNVIEDRWAYDILPPGSEKIREGILNFTKG